MFYLKPTYEGLKVGWVHKDDVHLTEFKAYLWGIERDCWGHSKVWCYVI